MEARRIIKARVLSDIPIFLNQEFFIRDARNRLKRVTIIIAMLTVKK